MARAITARAKKAKQAEKAKLHNYYDYGMFMLVIFIVAFGLVMIYSSSSYMAQTHEDYNYDGAFFL